MLRPVAPLLRQVVRNSISQWACGPIVKLLRKGETEDGLAVELIGQDVAATRKKVKKDWQKQAPDYIAAQKPRRRRDWLDKPPRSRL